MSRTTVVCPVSSERINENVARIAAFFVIIITITGVCFNMPFLIAALAVDFYLRAFTSGKYSPIKVLARRFGQYIGVGSKPADAAPKKFAAGIGLLFTIAIANLQWFGFTLLADSFGTVLLICAALESFFGYCLGCVIYTYTVAPFFNKANS